MRLRPRKDSNLKESNTFLSRINRDTVDGSYKIDNCDEHCKYYTGSLISSLPWRDSCVHVGCDIELDYSSSKNDIYLDYSTFLKNLRQNSIMGPDDKKSLVLFRYTTEGEKIDTVKNSTNITAKVKVKLAKHRRDVNISRKVSHKSQGFLKPCKQYFLDFGEKESNDTVFKMKDRKVRRYGKEAEKPLSPTALSVKVEKVNTVKQLKNFNKNAKIRPAKDTRDFNNTGTVNHKSKGFLNPCEQSFLDFGEKESNDIDFKIKDRKIRRHEKVAEKRVCVTNLPAKVEKISSVKISKNITEKVKVKAAEAMEDDSIAGRLLKRRKQSLLDSSVNKSSGLAERCLSDTKLYLKAKKINEVKSLTTIIDNVTLEPAKDLKDVDMFEKFSHNSKGDLKITHRCDHSFWNFEKKQSSSAFVTENGKKLKYEIKAEECVSDTEIYVMGDDPVCSEGNFTPFECNKQYLRITDTGAEDMVDRGRSYFREEVMNIYKKSYDQDEYEQLLEAVKSKKPIKGRKKHRKSLLEHNPDLKAELDRFFFDRPKMLNILRGFYYWLQNISHEGIFKPWLDPTCQAMKPMFKACSSHNC